MHLARVTVTGRTVAQNGGTTLIESSIGVDELQVYFDNAEWLGFPVQVTFAHSGGAEVTQALVLEAVEGSADWAATSTVPIPWEVMAEVGTVSLAFFGTDADDNHIVTAAGGSDVLSVIEAGEVGDGTVPEPAPTQDEWNQAYAAALAAANDAESAAETVRGLLLLLDVNEVSF